VETRGTSQSTKLLTSQATGHGLDGVCQQHIQDCPKTGNVNSVDGAACEDLLGSNEQPMTALVAGSKGPMS